MSYHDVMANPVSTVERIYDHAGLKMKAEHAQAIRQWLAYNPASKHGTYKYSTDEFGLNPDSINRQFKDYVDRFGFGYGIRLPLTV